MVAQSPFPYNCFFTAISLIPEKIINETTASKHSVASAPHPSTSGSFSGSSACEIHTTSYPLPSQKQDCLSLPLTHLRNPASHDAPANPIPAPPSRPPHPSTNRHLSTPRSTKSACRIRLAESPQPRD